MKTIKIFLASSDELTDDRNAFGNLVRRLDKLYEKRGIRIELFEWEDYDAAYNDRRKQDEYNDQIKASDMFLALFHTKAGKFTIEEFDVATEEFKKHASPKVYTYCKELQENEVESPELVKFKERLFNEMGHYWSRYNNRDSMQLHFVMQLQLVETSGVVEKLKLEEGTVMLEDMPIARIDNLQFATGNETYQKISAELADLPEKIGKARKRVDKFPDDNDLKDDLQQIINRHNYLKEEFAQLQKGLFETAQRIASMQTQRISELLRRAIESFQDGYLERANTLLDEIVHDADRHMEQLNCNRFLVHQDIEAFLLQAKIIMTDVTVKIEDRIKKVYALYSKADEWARISSLHDEIYEVLLEEYGDFLSDYAFYDKALDVYIHTILIKVKLYGTDHPNTASANDNIGLVYRKLGYYDKALEYLTKAMDIREKVFGFEHPSTAASYNNIGMVYNDQGDYDKALEYHLKALNINKKVVGIGHIDTAVSYNNIGVDYDFLGNYDKALEYYIKALNIRKEILSIEHPDIAASYNNIALTYNNQGDYDKALECHFKALDLETRVLGFEHPSIGASYNNIGMVYSNQGYYDKALEYHFKALNIREKVLGFEHSDTGSSYNNIGTVYQHQGDFDKALEYYIKALNIREKVLGFEHSDTASSYNNIGTVYCYQGDYEKALEFYNKSLKILEKKLGIEHPATQLVLENVQAAKKEIGWYKTIGLFKHFSKLIRKGRK